MNCFEEQWVYTAYVTRARHSERSFVANNLTKGNTTCLTNSLNTFATFCSR